MLADKQPCTYMFEWVTEAACRVFVASRFLSYPCDIIASKSCCCFFGNQGCFPTIALDYQWYTLITIDQWLRSLYGAKSVLIG